MNNMLVRILALIKKEILAVWRDKKSRMVLVIPPIVQLFIFSFAATLDVTDASIGILNRDNGEQAFELVQRFHGAPVFKHITYLRSVEEIAPFVDNMKGIMVVSIDQQFSRNLDAGNVAYVQLIFDGRKSNAAQIVAGYTTDIINQFNKDFATRAGYRLQNAELIPRNWFNPNLLYYWFNVPSLVGVLTMLVAVVVTALSVARERELGTFDQLLVSPITPFEIMVGKAIPAIIIGMIEGSFMIFVAIIIFQIPFTGSFLSLYFSMFVFVTSLTGAGLFISSLCATQQQAILGSYMLISPSILLSGFATPIENMPTWLQPFTYLIPLRYFLVVVKGSFLKAMPFDMVWHNTWPMAIIAVITLTGATWYFRRRLQ